MRIVMSHWYGKVLRIVMALAWVGHGNCHESLVWEGFENCHEALVLEGHGNCHESRQFCGGSCAGALLCMVQVPCQRFFLCFQSTC